MTLKPKLSVITPVYNREKYLPECIESILNQTFEDFEFILIDDHSTDGTSKIIKEYELKDNRIKFLSNKLNIGATQSFNNGLKISVGKYIARMDSDDISLPDRFQKQIDILENWDELEVIGTGAILINGNGVEIGRKKFPSDYKKIKKILMTGVPVFDPSVIIRSETLKRIGGFDNRLAPADDYHLWLSLFKNKKLISNLNDYLIKYRIHETNLSKLQLSEQLKKTFIAKKIYESKLSIDDYLQTYKNDHLNEFETIIVKKWKNRETTYQDTIAILNIYFKDKKTIDRSNQNKILILLQVLFYKKKFIIFFKYLIKFLYYKFI